MRHSLENRMLGFPSSLCETVSKESLRLHESIFQRNKKKKKPDDKIYKKIGSLTQSLTLTIFTTYPIITYTVPLF